MIDRLRRILGRPEPTPVSVTLYTRAGCTCCEKAKAVLEAAQRRRPLTIEAVDVDSDPALVERYGHEVPVVAIDGRVRFRGVVNPVLLERLLAGRDA